MSKALEIKRCFECPKLLNDFCVDIGVEIKNTMAIDSKCKLQDFKDVAIYNIPICCENCGNANGCKRVEYCLTNNYKLYNNKYLK